MNRAELDKNFLKAAGWESAQRLRIAGDASFRHYDRLEQSSGPAILMDAPPPREDVRPFVAIAEHLLRLNLSAPKILAQDVVNGFLLLEDLGDDRFSRVIPQEPQREMDLYRAAVETLVELHKTDAPASLPVADQVFAVPRYDDALYMRELQLFTDWYLPARTGRPMTRDLRDEFSTLWRDALGKLEAPREVLVLRDYHADNLMWLPERDGVARVGLLDFQDAVAGHPAYDLVSLLEDARRDVSPAVAEAMLAHYIAVTGVEDQAFRRDYAILGAQRNSKIIGIFIRLYARDGKPGYLDLIPRVWRLLEQDLTHPILADLRAWYDRHMPKSMRDAAPRASDIQLLPKTALMLAAGLGTRMQPLTFERPKPLIEVAGQPMIDRILDQLAEAGVDRALANIHYLPDHMRRFAQSRKGRLPDFSLSDETDELLDSGGGVRKMAADLETSVFVLNSDMLWRDRAAPALVRMGLAFREDMDVLLLLCPREKATGYDGPGDFYLEADGRLSRRGDRLTAPYVFTGIQILRPESVRAIDENVFSLNRVYNTALEASRLFGLVHEGDWMHVGTPDAIALAEAELRKV